MLGAQSPSRGGRGEAEQGEMKLVWGESATEEGGKVGRGWVGCHLCHVKEVGRFREGDGRSLGL